MDDRELSEDLFDFNLEDILNLTFDLDSSNSLDKISPQWLDELTSSMTIENNEISTRNATLPEDRTADVYTETVRETNEQNAENIDPQKNQSTEQPSNHVEIIILNDAFQDDATLLSPIVDLQTENVAADSLWMQNSDLITKATEPRICLSKEELSILEREFQICHYPDRFTRKKMALALNLPRLTVSEWFTNRRIKMRNSEENVETNRICFGKNQVAMLEREFEKSHYPDCLTRQKLSLMLGLRDTTVKNWFHHRRVKMRKSTENEQIVSLEAKFNNLSASETSFQRQNFAEDVNNNQVVTVEHVSEEQQSCYDIACESMPNLNFGDQQFEEPQTEIFSLSRSTEANQDSEQKTVESLEQLLQPSVINNQEIHEPQIESSSLSSSPESNQSSEQKIPENLDDLVPPQTEACSPNENSFLVSSGSSNRKRKRTNFCKNQISALEQQFVKCKYPDYDTICELASTIKVTDDKVRVWFKNRRSKQRDLEKRGQIAQLQFESTTFLPPKSPSTQKCKKISSRKSRLRVLEREFKICRYPNLDRLFQLASKTNFTNSQVRRWFTQRRAKQRLLEKRGKKVPQVQKGTSMTLSTESFKPNYQPKGTRLNTNQLAVLEREFSKCHYPESGAREKLASAINLTFSQVSKWFENRRVKERKLWGHNQSSTLNSETSRFWRQRTDFNETQLAILEKEYKMCQYPDYEMLNYLVSIVDMPYTVIREWFSNRREKERVSEISLFSETFRPQYCARKIQFNKRQLAILEQAFSTCPYLDYDTTCSLSAMINVSYERVRTWFTNRRAKQRKFNKYGQLPQHQIGTTSYLTSSEWHQNEAQDRGEQLQQYQNCKHFPMVPADYYNNSLCNTVQQMRVSPQNLRFGWYNSVSPVFISQNHGATRVSPIKEDPFYVNPTPPSAQYVYSHSYDAPMPNHSFLVEL